jgi:hypothetical protein
LKLIVIPDLHGDTCWPEILMKETFDKVIFLGDYLDSPTKINGKEELANLNAIIDLKKKSPEQFFLLLGNHEFHYTAAGIKVDERSPRFQPAYASAFRETLFNNREMFQLAYKVDQYLFSHAGVTHHWLSKFSGKLDCDSIDKAVNETWERQPQAFALTPEGRAHDWGDDKWQSPIWVRPGSLQSGSEKFKSQIIQVVGHTPKPSIEVSDAENQRYYFVDTLRYSKEYLVINNGCASVSRQQSTLKSIES